MSLGELKDAPSSAEEPNVRIDRPFNCARFAHDDTLDATTSELP